MTTRTCTFEGCLRPHEARGLCHTHLAQQMRDPDRPLRPIRSRDPLVKFEAKITRLPAGHWIWRGATNGPRTYGIMSLDGRTQQAQRVAYQLFVGPIPEGFEVDHLCRKTLCVNPEHLEAVPHAVNNLRSDSASSLNAAKTHCDWGHEFSPDNTFIRSNGGRLCITCDRSERRRIQRRDATRRWRARQAEAKAANASHAGLAG